MRTPVTYPVDGSIDAILPLLDDQVPPGVASESSMVLPIQTLIGNMVGGTKVIGSIVVTVTAMVAKQPEQLVYVSVYVPVVRPVAIPEVVPINKPVGSLELQVPQVPSEYETETPGHISDGPTIEAGPEFTFTICVT